MNINEERSQSSPPVADSPQPPRRKAFGFWRCFWLTFLVASLSYAWYCFYAPSNDIAWADDYPAAQQLAAETGKPIILFFTGDWCVPCRIMKRTVWADEQVADSVSAAFIPVTIDVDDPAAAPLMGRFGVGATPNTIITDSQGTVLSQAAGGLNKASFLELLDQAKRP